MKDLSFKIYAIFALLLTIGVGRMNADQNWEAVHMFVVPQALWAEWSDNYTLKVSLKRWNGDDADENNWDTYTFYKCDAVYDNKAVYFGDVWICYDGFAQMAFDAYNGESKVLEYTFWPPQEGESETNHWIAKADFENKVFYGWNTDYLTDFPFIHSEAGNRIWFDNSKTQWENVYVRIGRDALTGAGNYAATWPMTRLSGTNLWYVDSEAWDNALVWTITDTNDNNGEQSVYSLPSGANRTFYFNYSITERVLYLADGDAAMGTEDSGVNYWACHNVVFFTRDGLTPGNYGTVCLPMGSPEFAGAEFYRVAGKEMDGELPVNIVLESVNALAPGTPYVFRATADIMVLHNEGTYAEEPDNSQSNGLIGSYEIQDIDDEEYNYILHDNQLYQVNQSKVGQYRAYFDLSAMSEYDPAAPASASLRRMGINRPNMPTALENAAADAVSTRKVLRNGHLYIERDGRIYTIQGQSAALPIDK